MVMHSVAVLVFTNASVEVYYSIVPMLVCQCSAKCSVSRVQCPPVWQVLSNKVGTLPHQSVLRSGSKSVVIVCWY